MTLLSLFQLIEALAEALGQDFPSNLALIFFRVARAGPQGVLRATVQRELRLPPVVVTRAIQTLSVGSRSGSEAISTLTHKGTPGLDLIAVTLDAQDGRNRVLKLTPKGEALAAKLQGESFVPGARSEAAPSPAGVRLQDAS